MIGIMTEMPNFSNLCHYAAECVRVKFSERPLWNVRSGAIQRQRHVARTRRLDVSRVLWFSVAKRSSVRFIRNGIGRSRVQ